MPADTLKEFLVAVGFTVDENSYSKFNTKIGKATAGTLELGTAVAATAVAIEVAVAKMARQFEDLFYVSQRTNSAVRSLQSFEYGARNIGVTSDQARGAVEGLARAMRSSPGVGSLLNQLGVQTQGREGTQIMSDLVGQLKKMPFYLAAQYGQLVGLDPDTLLMMMSRYDEMLKAQEDYSKRSKDAGIDTKKLAEDSRNFGNVLRSLEATFGLIGERIEQNFIGPMTKGVALLDEMSRKFIEIDKSTNGWATTLMTIGTSALAVWTGKLLLGKLLFRGAVAGATEAETAKVATGAATKTVAKAGFLRRLLGGGGATALWSVDLDERGTAKSPEIDVALSRAMGKGGGKTAMEKAVSFFMNNGWSREQSIGIASNLNDESKFNPRSVGDSGSAVGIGQWHEDRQAEFKKQFGKNIGDASLEEQLQFVQFELTRGAEQFAGAMIRKAGSPSSAAAAVSRFYERPRGGDATAASRGDRAQAWYDAGIGAGNGSSTAVTQHIQTHIDVKSTDPKEAAREVVDNQKDVTTFAARYAGATVR